MAIILKNGTFIDYKTLEFKKTDIKVTENSHELEFAENFNSNNKDTIIDCTNKYITKSFVNGHHHSYSALAKGMPAPKQKPLTFIQNLQFIWWAIDKSLDKEMIEACALSSAIESAKSGVTFVIDHHASPNTIDNSLDIIAKAYDKIGVSHLLCYENSVRDGIEKAEQGLAETRRYLQKKQGLVGLHASFTVSDELLADAVTLMDDTNSGIHIHVAEADIDQTNTIRDYKKRIIERLNEAGVLKSSKTILGHCLHVNDDERFLFKNSEAYIVQNMESNLKNNVGYFNSEWLGDRIFLGTDGMHSDMLRSAKMAFIASRGKDDIGELEIYNRLRKTDEYLLKNQFTGNESDNLIVLDYNPITEFASDNFLGHLIYGFDSSHIQYVISSGKLIVDDYNIAKVDENEVYKFTREQSIRLWEKLKNM